MIQKYGLVGYPVAHSFSAEYFNSRFHTEGIEASYSLYPLLSIDELPSLLESTPNLVGLNVTSPYKEKVCKYLTDWGNEQTQVIGAVNTLKIDRGIDGSIQAIIGYNTDIWGFEQSLYPLLTTRPINSVLILGTGGASRAVDLVFSKLDISTAFVSRTGQGITYQLLMREPERLRDFQLIINATPLGLDGESLPLLPYSFLTKEQFCYDLIYNPSCTPFLQKAEEYGCSIKNGLEMLYLQAEENWRIWEIDSFVHIRK